MAMPADFHERVYAGVLGKMIGVYLGRPFEQWTNAAIEADLGEITYYVNKRLGQPLVVTDDDLTGTFAFLQAYRAHAAGDNLTSEQIGQTWCDIIIEGRTILWWGGRGNSTEHTAFLNLQRGLAAPASGAAATNGRAVSEQIGAQIFIDGWAMICPGDPQRAADLAGRAARVSHDGLAVEAAQVLAAMEALAFVERDLGRILDQAVRFISLQSPIAALIADLRRLRSVEPDWHRALSYVQAHYGNDRHLGMCHMIPNHAIIHLALLYGGDDFQRAMTIANTSGWDTDCNAGNVGCFLGIKNGLAAFEGGPDWRGPVADRLYLPTAAGGRAITDAAREAVAVINLARTRHALPAWQPKGGARFHFAFPGSVQSFKADNRADVADATHVANVLRPDGTRALAIRFEPTGAAKLARATTLTFVPPEALTMSIYDLIASPTLYPGQTVRACIAAKEQNAGNVTVRLVLEYYEPSGTLTIQRGPAVTLAPNSGGEMTWRLPPDTPMPIVKIGFEIEPPTPTEAVVLVDRMDWSGAPDFTFGAASPNFDVALRAWTHDLDHFMLGGDFEFRRSNGRKTYRSWFAQEAAQPQGYLSAVASSPEWASAAIGTDEWCDYSVSVTANAVLAEGWGLAVGYQGLRRYLAVRFAASGAAQLVWVNFAETVLGETKFAWNVGRDYRCEIRWSGEAVDVLVDGKSLLAAPVPKRPTRGGGAALLVRAGHITFRQIVLRPMTRPLV